MSQDPSTAVVTPDPDPDPQAAPPRRKPARKAVVLGAGKLKSTRKSTEYEIMQRRKEVKRLRMRGKSYPEIATELKVSVFTIKGDIKFIQQSMADQIDKFEQNQFLGVTMDVLDEVMEHAWEEFHEAEKGTKQRIQALDLVRTTAGDKLTAMMDVGLVQKAAEEVKVTHQHALPWDDSIKQAVIDKMLQSTLTQQLALPTPDPLHMPGANIDVTPVQEAVLVAPPVPSDDVLTPAQQDAKDKAEDALRKMVGAGLSVEQARHAIESASEKK